MSTLHDDFNSSVPYSLNRKNRWNAIENQADYLVNSAEHSACVRFSILESYFTGFMQSIDESELLIEACHALEKNNTDLNLKTHRITSRYAKSARGSTIKNLLSIKSNDNNDENNLSVLTTTAGSPTKNSLKLTPLRDYDLNVQYKIFKQHPVLKCMGISMPKKGN